MDKEEFDVVSRIFSMCERSYRPRKKKGPKLRKRPNPITVTEKGSASQEPTHTICSECWEIKPLGEFHADSASRFGHSARCKDCACRTSRENAKANPQRCQAHNAKRHADKLKRTPAWADLDAISFFYECRPKGCHVDHVVPLRGKTISGLHIETNLQWLPARQNLRKSNIY